ncbi:MAG: hypothetical protein HOP07_07765 [Bacteriovoracaceae bacterium]|nr:hypothetical protein [Bacteriovoracaceae bacterium]
MIKNKDPNSKIASSFLITILLHSAIFALVSYSLSDWQVRHKFNELSQTLKNSVKIDQIKIIHPKELEQIRKVGIKNGIKNLERPDLKPELVSRSLPGQMSLEKLAPSYPTNKNPIKNQVTTSENPFYFNYNNKKDIPRSNEQDRLKNEAVSLNGPMNKATEKMSNFEIRYERPEGVSEDELNSDEKAYYSFYVRSYKNFYSKIYANYEKILIERPGLAKVFDRKHTLIGKIDYDENGNIVTVRILKSSDSDDLHYFFEETLKDLSQPNPPKIFTKNRKEFSIFYQIQIN